MQDQVAEVTSVEGMAIAKNEVVWHRRGFQTARGRHWRMLSNGRNFFFVADALSAAQQSAKRRRTLFPFGDRMAPCDAILFFISFFGDSEAVARRLDRWLFPPAARTVVKQLVLPRSQFIPDTQKMGWKGVSGKPSGRNTAGCFVPKNDHSEKIFVPKVSC